MRLPPLARLGPYEIVELLGAGGMGEVYLARDTRLDRQVAIKRLLTGASGEHGERFWREARAAAAVSHPNVCQIFDVGEHAGEPYLAMELLAGESLAARIARGPLGPAPSAAVLGQVLAALAALHVRGLIHRDLKPANVFLTPHGDPWGVKVLDFGLALATGGGLSGDPRLTRTGTLLGTPGFMAPEQWLGEGVGPATDIFACGAMLYEMLTARPAFAGDGPIAIYEAVTRGQRPRLGLAALAAFEPIVERALACQSKDRFQSAPAMAAALAAAVHTGAVHTGAVHTGAVHTGAVHTGEVSASMAPTAGGEPTLVSSRPTPAALAATSVLRGSPQAGAPRASQAAPRSRLLVVPFRQLRPDAETEFLGLALAEAVSASLGGLSRLIVRSPRVASRFADLDDLAAIAAGADVDAVLVGSLQRAGDRIRCSAQLLAVPSGTVLAAHTAQATMADLFDLQDDLARQVVEALRVPLSGRDQRQLAADVPSDPHAYELYLKASAATANTASTSAMQSLQDLLERCVELDPGYAPAWARLGRIYGVRAKFGHSTDPAADRRRAQHAFERALALSPDLPLAHNYYTYFEIEALASPGSAMLRLLGQLEARPDDADLFAGLVVACRFCGLLDASLAAHLHARRCDPLVRTSVAYTHLARCDFAHAATEDDDPVAFVRHYCLPLVTTSEEAHRSLELWQRQLEGSNQRLVATGMLAAVTSDAAGCAAAVEELLTTRFDDAEGLYMAVRCLSQAGAVDRALAVLTRVVGGGFTCPQAFDRDPWLANLRRDPRFEPLRTAALEGRRRARGLFVDAGGPRLLAVDEPP
jgi:serine/threonine protein kinase